MVTFLQHMFTCIREKTLIQSSSVSGSSRTTTGWLSKQVQLDARGGGGGGGGSE